MSQYYPPQRPSFPPPPPENPEGNYYYDEGDYEYETYDDSADKWYKQPLVAFTAGGCLAFMCMFFCITALGGLWLIDSSLGDATAADLPGSDIGLTFDDPAFPNESVVNDQGAQLTILEANRNAVVEAIPPVEGREIIIVTVELVNLGESDVAFNERDFQLVNSFEEVYEPTIGAIAGALGRGTLPPNEGLEGRLVFEVVQGDTDLRLWWEPGRDSTPRYLYLE